MNARIRILATGLLAVLVGVGTYFFAVRPMQAGMAADRVHITERRKKLVELERVTRRITDLQEEIGKLEDALAFFDNRLPEEREVDVILREVWRIATAKDLAARSFRTTKVEASDRYRSQEITLHVDGPFPNFYDFLLGLEQLPRITKVRDMVIQKSPSTEGAIQVDVGMDIFFEKRS